MGNAEISKIFERIERERKAEIKKIKASNMPEWEKKMTLRAVRSGVWGW